MDMLTAFVFTTLLTVPGSSSACEGPAAAPAVGSDTGVPEQVSSLRGVSQEYWSSPHHEPGVSPGELLRRPLVVNGEVVPLADLQRFLIFGAGKTLIEAKKFEAIMLNEVALRGQTLEPYQISDADLEKAVIKARDDFELAYPALDFKTEVRRAFRDFDLWKTHQRETMMFDRIFLPDNPEQWPAVTTMAIIDESQGSDMFVIDAKDVYVERVTKMQEEGLEELPAYPMMYLEILRSMVLDSLHKFAQIDVFPELMPEGAVMVVDGTVIDLEETFAWLEPYLSWKDVQEARYWAAKMTALEQDLSASGDLLDRVTFAQEWSQYEAERMFENMLRQQEKQIPDEDPEVVAQKLEEWVEAYNMEPHSYQRMLFDRQMLGLQSDRFPSMWAWGEHRRLMESFRKRLGEKMEDSEELQTILPHTNQITGLAKCDSDMILISAFDFPSFEWKEDGWPTALERALEVKQLLDDGADWKETLDSYSDFWDPPQPETGPQKPIFGFKFKGQWGEQTRNNLLGKTEESNFTTFVYGEPLADYAFFEQATNTVAGPFRGPYGYYLTKVNRRSPFQRPLNLGEPRHFELAQDYYLRHMLTERSRELMETSDIEGLYGAVRE